MSPKMNVQKQLKEARALSDQGKQDYKNGYFNTSYGFFHRAVQIQESVLGKCHTDTVKTYWRMGRLACMANE
jgi:ribosomal protein S25